jgi:hypothetical protein
MTTDTDLKELRDLIIGLREEVRVSFAQVDIKLAQVETKLAQLDTKIFDLRGCITLNHYKNKALTAFPLRRRSKLKAPEPHFKCQW